MPEIPASINHLTSVMKTSYEEGSFPEVIKRGREIVRLVGINQEIKAIEAQQAGDILDAVFKPFRGDPRLWQAWWDELESNVEGEKYRVLMHTFDVGADLIQARLLGVSGPEGIPSVNPVLEQIAAKYGLPINPGVVSLLRIEPQPNPTWNKLALDPNTKPDEQPERATQTEAAPDAAAIQWALGTGNGSFDLAWARAKTGRDPKQPEATQEIANKAYAILQADAASKGIELWPGPELLATEKTNLPVAIGHRLETSDGVRVWLPPEVFANLAAMSSFPDIKGIGSSNFRAAIDTSVPTRALGQTKEENPPGELVVFVDVSKGKKKTPIRIDLVAQGANNLIIEGRFDKRGVYAASLGLSESEKEMFDESVRRFPEYVRAVIYDSLDGKPDNAYIHPLALDPVAKRIVFDVEKITPVAVLPEATAEISNEDVIQKALDSGHSRIAAYTSQGLYVVQQADDHRNLSGGEDSIYATRQAAIAETRDIVTNTLSNAGVYEIVVRRAVAGSNAGDEPANILYYSATDRGLKDYDNLFFRDSHGRPGNSFTIEITLPQQVAEQIGDRVKQNPQFIRAVSDAFVRQKYDKGFVEQSWDRYARPPYEKWDTLPGRKLYFADLVRNPQDAKMPLAEVINRAIPLNGEPAPVAGHPAEATTQATTAPATAAVTRESEIPPSARRIVEITDTSRDIVEQVMEILSGPEKEITIAGTPEMLRQYLLQQLLRKGVKSVKSSRVELVLDKDHGAAISASTIVVATTPFGDKEIEFFGHVFNGPKGGIAGKIGQKGIPSGFRRDIKDDIKKFNDYPNAFISDAINTRLMAEGGANKHFEEARIAGDKLQLRFKTLGMFIRSTEPSREPSREARLDILEAEIKGLISQGIPEDEAIERAVANHKQPPQDAQH